ncbi:MAG: hypothetical protein KJ607_11175, partial [Bacteroidetes bacterium]|nr:hypothetical protein [Bacteroidota bacterium]
MKKYTRLIPLLAIFVVPVIASATDYTVTNTNDSGAGSLREAYTSANSAYGPDNIYFNIPMSDQGYNSTSGTWTIQFQTALPYLATGYITVDGTTQAANQGNTNPDGPEIVIDGNNAVEYAFC